MLRQHAEPAAHLEHDVVGLELGEAADDLEDVVVDQEVLPELAVRANRELSQAAEARLTWPRYHPKTRAALRSTSVSSSSYATPRRDATCSAVLTTLAGSFGFPRTRLWREVGRVRLDEQQLVRHRRGCRLQRSSPSDR